MRRAARLLEADGSSIAEALTNLVTLLEGQDEDVTVDALGLFYYEDEDGDLAVLVTAYRGEQVDY